ncbi:hypothetical protein CQA62_00210 [Helicobacter cholecystus]|uniref:Uncharacterized protein n=1 Tax=Helicobacter cholecystus TaxID=45498 RepID=A0A3D8IY20_9HELI|nr:PepSY-associated TM helix domain-containing protein [Helicobacter cholecystus]RDU69876.1 hypothetical protein CQA62_00210 [Helicobacter cholecystus]VEJ25744.1 integral membrane protein [Helicobacter cholecystus]
MGKTFRQIHIYVSLFFLPLALMYAVTGIMLVCGFNQDTGAKKQVLHLPGEFDRNRVVQELKILLQSNNIALPSNFEPQKAKGGGVMYGSAAYNVVVQAEEKGMRVTVTQRSFIGLIMLLHKGKIKWYFNVLAFGFAFALVALYISGLIIANLNKIKTKAWITVGIGFLITIILGYLSVI